MTWPLGHISLDAQVNGEHSLLDQLEAPAAELGISAMAVSHREVRLAALCALKKAIAALRLQLVGGD